MGRQVVDPGVMALYRLAWMLSCGRRVTCAKSVVGVVRHLAAKLVREFERSPLHSSCLTIGMRQCRLVVVTLSRAMSLGVRHLLLVKVSVMVRVGATSAPTAAATETTPEHCRKWRGSLCGGATIINVIIVRRSGKSKIIPVLLRLCVVIFCWVGT